MSKSLKETICEERVFSSIYNKYAQDLHDFLYYKYGEQFGPNDKAQEAFVKLWENCKNVSIDKAKSFLFTVANNMVLNDIKHQKVVLKHRQTKPIDFTNENPEFLLEKDQYLQAYQKALSNLNEEQRVAFLLNKTEGKKHQEIADMLGVTKKVVEYRIYSAFDSLKNELEVFLKK